MAYQTNKAKRRAITTAAKGDAPNTGAPGATPSRRRSMSTRSSSSASSRQDTAKRKILDRRASSRASRKRADLRTSFAASRPDSGRGRFARRHCGPWHGSQFFGRFEIGADPRHSIRPATAGARHEAANLAVESRRCVGRHFAEHMRSIGRARSEGLKCSKWSTARTETLAPGPTPETDEWIGSRYALTLEINRHCAEAFDDDTVSEHLQHVSREHPAPMVF